MAPRVMGPEAAGPGIGSIPETPLPQGGAHPPSVQSPAERACMVIIHAIRSFEAQLGSGDEVAMGFTGGEAGILRIAGLGFHPPDLVTFQGKSDDGRRMHLIQHVSQVSVVLRAVPKAEPHGPARRIGFDLIPDTFWAGGEAGDASAEVTTT